MADVKFGWRIPAFPVDGSRKGIFTNQIVATLERIKGRFTSAWIADHFIPWHQALPVETDTLECWTTLCYLAARYPETHFGTVVLCQSYRNPALLAKMGATLQLLSGGRFILGLGAGWMAGEFQAYGYDFPSADTRLTQLEEAVQIIRGMWTNTPVTFQGQHYRVENAYCEPKPEPRPPLMIGGGGEKRTLRIVAQYADWWNIPGGDPATYAHKLKVLRSHCEAVGRDYDSIVKTWAGETVAIAKTEAEAQRLAQASPFGESRLVGTPEQIAAYLRGFTDLGVEHFIFRFADFPDPAGIELFAEAVIPRFG